MKNKKFRSIRWKFLSAPFLAGILAAITTIGLFFLALVLADNQIWLISDILNVMAELLGVLILPILVVVAIVLFFFYFRLLTRKSIKYLGEITATLAVIAQGDLDVTIPIRSNDELGLLAQNINDMAAELKRSIEYERNAELTKNELITSVSHDLRTPLTSIMGYLELITTDRYDDEVRLRYYADIAHQKSKSLKRMIDDLFELTTLNYGNIELKLSKIDLGQLLEQLTEEFVPILYDRGMEYRLFLPDYKIELMADAHMLVRVFENLISNAIRYGREGRYVDIYMERKGSRAIVDVANYGNPIPKSELPYIFDRFHRVEQSRSTETGGTGLGLAIAKNIVEMHGGQIKAHAEGDKTVFRIMMDIDESLLDETGNNTINMGIIREKLWRD